MHIGHAWIFSRNKYSVDSKLLQFVRLSRDGRWYIIAIAILLEIHWLVLK